MAAMSGWNEPVRTAICFVESSEVAPTFAVFVKELEALSNRRDIGLAVNTWGGILAFNPSRDRVRYQQNPCSGDLEPVIEEISSNKTAGSTAFDFKSFSEELRKLSARHGIKLVSVGALFFWRTRAQSEVDLVVKQGDSLQAFEIKWSPRRVVGRAFRDAYGVAVESIHSANPFAIDIFKP